MISAFLDAATLPASMPGVISLAINAEISRRNITLLSRWHGYHAPQPFSMATFTPLITFHLYASVSFKSPKIFSNARDYQYGHEDTAASALVMAITFMMFRLLFRD